MESHPQSNPTYIILRHPHHHGTAASKESDYGSLFLVFDVNVLLASSLYFTYLLLIYCSVYYSLQLGVVVVDNYHTMKMY